jgi:hypothetical protein
LIFFSMRAIYRVHLIILDFVILTTYSEQYKSWSRFQWPRGLRRWCTAVRLLGLPVQIPPGACISVSCECCVLSGRGLCDWLFTRPEESYRVWCVWVWSKNLIQEALAQQRLSNHGEKKQILYSMKYTTLTLYRRSVFVLYKGSVRTAL